MNTQTQEALKMAIVKAEMLKQLTCYTAIEEGCEQIIQACKEALAQPAQEPVAVITPDNYGEPRLDFIGTFKYKATTAVNPDIPLYTHPAPQPAQEPVAWMSKKRGDVSKAKMYFNEGEEILPLYTHPAPSWQVLNDDDVEAIKTKAIVGAKALKVDRLLHLIVNLSEQALKEKNT